ncbi:hypothetical protein RhiirC2_805199, partial [Rhizophagus irregularis]
MSKNLARRGGGSYNPNSNRAAHSMDEDYEDFVANVLADSGLVGSTLTAILQQNNSRSISQENTQASAPNNSAAPIAPSQDASSGANASIHAPQNKENNSSLNASPNVDMNDGTSPDQAVDPSPTITIN